MACDVVVHGCRLSSPGGTQVPLFPAELHTRLTGAASSRLRRARAGGGRLGGGDEAAGGQPAAIAAWLLPLLDEAEPAAHVAGGGGPEQVGYRACPVPGTAAGRAGRARAARRHEPCPRTQQSGACQKRPVRRRIRRQVPQNRAVSHDRRRASPSRPHGELLAALRQAPGDVRDRPSIRKQYPAMRRP